MNQINETHTVRIILLLSLVMLISSCAKFKPTKEQFSEADLNNYYGGYPIFYEELIKEYLADKHKELPRSIIDNLHIFAPKRWWIGNKKTGKIWWGWSSVFKHATQTSPKFKSITELENGTFTIEAFVVYMPRRYYLKDNIVYGTSVSSNYEKPYQIIIEKRTMWDRVTRVRTIDRHQRWTP